MNTMACRGRLTVGPVLAGRVALVSMRLFTHPSADDIADFLSHLNPYLQKDIVRGLIATHGTHHVLQINRYKAKDYAHLGATWPMMRQHIYVIADTLTTALAKQFPSKFS